VVVKKTDDPVSVHLHGLRVGDAMEFKGALPVLPYRVGQYTTLGLIAGGTGVHFFSGVDPLVVRPRDPRDDVSSLAAAHLVAESTQAFPR